MKKTIWKWVIELTDRQVIEMPRGSKILTCQLQNGSICLWALVNPTQELEHRIIQIVGTGNPFEYATDPIYIASVQQSQFVWHIFESLT
jgi:hypothetical protein